MPVNIHMFLNGKKKPDFPRQPHASRREHAPARAACWGGELVLFMVQCVWFSACEAKALMGADTFIQSVYVSVKKPKSFVNRSQATRHMLMTRTAESRPHWKELSFQKGEECRSEVQQGPRGSGRSPSWSPIPNCYSNQALRGAANLGGIGGGGAC